MTTKRVRMVIGAAAMGLVVCAARPQGDVGGPGPQKMTREEILDYQMTVPVKATPATGKALYEKHCAKCHRFGAIGIDVGPDLTTLSFRFRKKDVLESILWPSRIVSDQYESEVIQTPTGQLNVLVVRETPAALQVRTPDSPDKPIVVQKNQIQAREKSKISFMPEGQIDQLTQPEIASLVAFVLGPAPKTAQRPY